MLMESVEGAVRTVELTAGAAVHIPGESVHRSVNVGDVPFSTLFRYPADTGQNYQIIQQAGGMATMVVTDGNDGWTTRPNPRHRGYARAPRPIFESAPASTIKPEPRLT